MRSLLTICALLIIGNTAVAADKQTGELHCGLVKGNAGKQKTTKIICEDVGFGSCTEYTNLELKLQGITMSVNQIFEKISIEVTDIKGKELLVIEGENRVNVNLGAVGSKNQINATCVVDRK